MAYTIQAIVTEKNTSDLYRKPGLLWVTLPQAMVLAALDGSFCEHNSIPFLPLTDEGLKSVPGQIFEICAEISAKGKVAYIEAEIHGGVGIQASVVWNNGKVTSGVIVADDAINQALKSLGIKIGESRDEFEALGLGKHRNTDDWNKP